MGLFDWLPEFPKLSGYGKLHLSASIAMALIVIAMQAAIAGVFLTQVDLEATVPMAPPGKEILYPSYCNANTSSSQGEPADNNAKSIMVYLIIFILAQVFQFYLVIDALWQQNTIQIIMHVIFVCCCLAYSIIQYFQINDLLNPCAVNVAFLPSSTLDFSTTNCNAGCQLEQQLVPFIAVTIATLALFTMTYVGLAVKLYLEFGWKIYKKIGAAPEMRAMYRGFHLFIMLLKLDVFFFEAFAIQFLYLVLESTDPEFGLTIVAIISAIPIAVFAYFSVVKENMWMMILWFCVLIGIGAYYLFKITRIYTQPAMYVGSGKFLTLFATLGLLVTLVSAATSAYCWRNFGEGLKPYLNSGEPASERNSVNMGSKDASGRERVDIN